MAGGSKTEKATPKRKQDERKKGNVFQSKDVVTAFSIIATFFSLKLLAPFIYRSLGEFILKYFGRFTEITELTIRDSTEIIRDFLFATALTTGPLLIVASLVAIVFTGAQTRFLFSNEAMKFKFNRINPLQGIKKLFSVRSVAELLKSLIKVIIVGYVLYLEVSKRIVELPSLLELDIFSGVIYTCDAIMSLVLTITIMFIFIALADYIFQWWQYEKDLKMTKQEVKEEYKQLEGDPQIKGKIKEKQRQMAQARMMQNVPTADVVVRNPTHFAVAIRYNPDKNLAPVVVAKGVDLVALRIVKVAEENNVYIMENIELARGLFKAVDIDMEIPASFYHAVAEVLAFVYNLRKKRKVK